RLGTELAAKAGADSLVALRAMPAERLLEATQGLHVSTYSAAIDGYFLQKSVYEVFDAGEQAHVPLLVGWNSEEVGYRRVLGEAQPTPENYATAIRALYGELADEVLRLYPASTVVEVTQAAADLATDRFIGYWTWKWSDLHSATGRCPVYRYLYTHPLPPKAAPEGGSNTRGAVPARRWHRRGPPHAADIDYATGNLVTNQGYAWTPEDYAVSELMQRCYANFVQTGDPNEAGVPAWPAANRGGEVRVMRWDVEPKAEPERNRARYLFHDRFRELKGYFTAVHEPLRPLPRVR